MQVKIKRALISVSNKIGIVKFAEVLQDLGVEIISTGGTYNQLNAAKINAIKIEQLTGFPEMLDGRLKTLHPFVHGAILADRSKESHLRQVEEANIKLIDMVVVNLYPFKETVIKPGVTLEEAIENIDIGGPTMIRSAAKNHKSVAVIVDPEDYAPIAEELKNNNGALSQETCFALSVKAFQHTCEYDSHIFNYMINRLSEMNLQIEKEKKIKTKIFVRPYLKIDCTKDESTYINGINSSINSSVNSFLDSDKNFNKNLNLIFEKIQDLRYGENPHQKASYYKFIDAPYDCFANSTKLQGKELSYNNILDANAAFSIVKEFETPCVAIIKHNNPCGVATATTVTEAYHNAHFCDPLSAFGGIVACNYKWTSDAARFMKDKFVEVLIAPDFESEALEILKEKENLRILKINFNLDSFLKELESENFVPKFYDIKSVDGGIVVQEPDESTIKSITFQIVTEQKPTRSSLDDLLFAWQVVKNVKSNAIVLASGKATVGIGAGQMSRLDATKIAIEKAGKRAQGSVLASDAFFPFSDAVEIAINAGITAIIQPGGSVKDSEVISLCNKLKIPMLFTGKRHFKH